MATGVRVRNTYVTYLLLENSLRKLGLMFYSMIKSHDFIVKVEIRQKMDVRPIS